MQPDKCVMIYTTCLASHCANRGREAVLSVNPLALAYGVAVSSKELVLGLWILCHLPLSLKWWKASLEACKHRATFFTRPYVRIFLYALMYETRCLVCYLWLCLYRGQRQFSLPLALLPLLACCPCLKELQLCEFPPNWNIPSEGKEGVHNTEGKQRLETEKEETCKAVVKPWSAL